MADLPVARRDHREEEGDRRGDRQAQEEEAGSGEDQDAKDLLGRIGRRADRVGAEDRERLRPARVRGIDAACFATSCPSAL
jgi:hypothetical protein